VYYVGKTAGGGVNGRAGCKNLIYWVKSFHGVLLLRGKNLNKIGFHYFLGNWRVQREVDGPFAHPGLNRHTTAKSKHLNAMTTHDNQIEAAYCHQWQNKVYENDSVTRKSVWNSKASKARKETERSWKDSWNRVTRRQARKSAISVLKTANFVCNDNQLDEQDG
jgi:hypothetical protein